MVKIERHEKQLIPELKDKKPKKISKAGLEILMHIIVKKHGEQIEHG